jgi:exodeoxyribonuclease VII large subunit
VVHAHCVVQGSGAVASIISAIRRLEAHPEVEVIICGRGGGSLEDLWAFNEEAVVRAIAACAKPVISAVGHETDTTLADLAADVRAKTPTAAGELVVPVESELREQLVDWADRADQAMDALLEDARNQLAAYGAHRALTGPGYQIELRRQRLDELAGQLDEALNRLDEEARSRLRTAEASLRALHPGRLAAAFAERLALDGKRLDRAGTVLQRSAEDRIAALAGRLEALSPLAVIARGYSVVRDDQGRLVRRLADAPTGSHIAARLADGWLQATVDGQKPQKLNEPADVYDADR